MKTTKKEIAEKKRSIKLYSFEEVLTEASRSKPFKIAYDQELARLELAQQLRSVRLEKKLTQKAVADRIGMPQSVIARAESGIHGVSVDTLERIASAFGKRIQLV